jgi:hypothetical protein
MNRRGRFGVVLVCVASLIGAIAPHAAAANATAGASAAAPAANSARVDPRRAHLAEVARRRTVARNRVAVQLLESRGTRHLPGAHARLARQAASPSVTVTPSTNLGPGADVQLHGVGFTPPDSVLVIECAALTGARTCAPRTERTFSLATDGTFDAVFAVTRHIVIGDGTTIDCVAAGSDCGIAWLSLPSYSSNGAVPITFDPNAHSTSKISATPSTGLVDRQQITVAGTGFPASTSVSITECPAGADVTTCFNTGRGYAFTDDTGAFSGAMVVRRDTTSANGTTDCATGACELVAEPYEGIDFEARASVAFDPSGPPEPPIVLTVTPATKLLDAQSVTVSGSGFDVSSSVYITQCTPATTTPPQPPFERACRGFTYQPTDANGAFSVSLAVYRLIPSFSGGPPTDCAVATCDIEVTDEISGDFAAAALTFDASVPPPPPPSLHALPARALHDRQVITVNGEHFTVGGDVYFQECAAQAGSIVACRQLGEVDDVASTGRFSTTRRVERVLHRFDDGSAIDCADPTWVCQITASDESGFQPGATIGFSRGPLPPPPTATVTPSRKLRDHQHTRVTGSGWFPGDYVEITECATATDGSTLACAAAYGNASVGDDGHWSADFVVVRRMLSYGGCASVKCAPTDGTRPTIVDCIAAGVHCAISVFDYDDQAEASIPLQFDPGAPPAPPPSVRVTPRLGLHDGQTIHVHGEGFAPLSYVPIEQCDRSPLDASSTCRYAAETGADAHGVVDLDIVVRRIMQSSSNRVDCITPGVHCLIAVGQFDVELPRLVSITFDPSAPLDLPTVTATPSTGLSDGQSITITGTGFTPDVSVAAAECGAGTVGTQSCDIGHVVTGQADDSGNVSLTFTVHASLSTGTGTIDCTTGPGACVVGMANISDYSESNGAPITFGSG